MKYIIQFLLAVCGAFFVYAGTQHQLWPSSIQKIISPSHPTNISSQQSHTIIQQRIRDTRTTRELESSITNTLHNLDKFTYQLYTDQTLLGYATRVTSDGLLITQLPDTSYKNITHAKDIYNIRRDIYNQRYNNTRNINLISLDMGEKALRSEHAKIGSTLDSNHLGQTALATYRSEEQHPTAIVSYLHSYAKNDSPLTWSIDTKIPHQGLGVARSDGHLLGISQGNKNIISITQETFEQLLDQRNSELRAEKKPAAENQNNNTTFIPILSYSGTTTQGRNVSSSKISEISTGTIVTHINKSPINIDIDPLYYQALIDKQTITLTVIENDEKKDIKLNTNK